MQTKTNKSNKRFLFCRQPAHVLLVDFTPPFNDDVCSNLQSSLEEFFALVCSLAGPPRIPYFSISALHKYAECLLPLQNVRGNFQHIYNALWELRTLKPDMREGQSTTSLGQGLKDAVLQFNRQSVHIRQMNGYSTQLEVTVVSCQHVDTVARQIETAVHSIDLELIRKIQLVTLYNTENGVPINENDSSQSTGSSEDLAMTEILQRTFITNDPLSIGEYFKHWLYDCGTDREHLHLTLPDGEGTYSMKLKCDMKEQVLSPSLLPSTASSYNLLSEVNKSFTSGNKHQTASIPIVQLTAIKLIKASGLCESIVFGVPFVLHPTLCWKLDWEELDSNQQNFAALCQHLHERDMVLLTCHSSTTDKTPAQRSLTPTGHFVILPSHGSSLLVKPVASKELLLPHTSSNRVEKVVSDALEAVGSNLEQLEVCDVLNPLYFSSNLHQMLMSQLMKGNQWQKQQKRKITNKEQNKPAKVMAVRGRGKPGFQTTSGLTSLHVTSGHLNAGRVTTGHVTNSSITLKPNEVYCFGNTPKQQEFPTEL